MNELKKYFEQFDEKYKNLETIDREWYENEIGVKAFCSKATVNDKKNKLAYF